MKLVPKFLNWRKKKLWDEINRLNNHIKILNTQNDEQLEKIKFLKEIIKSDNKKLIYPALHLIDLEELLKLYKKDFFREFQIHDFIKQGLSYIVDSSSIYRGERLKEKSLNSNELKSLFLKYKSDKATRHNYGSFYENILQGKKSPLILEIGIGSENQNEYANGVSAGSLKAWREFFPKGKIIGADIDRDSVKKAGYPAFYVDQTNDDSIMELKKELNKLGPLDLIIDDGFHELHANLKPLLHLFECLNHGGSYVIEDVHESLIDLWILIGNYLKLDMEILDLREFRPEVSDNILVIFKRL